MYKGKPLSWFKKTQPHSLGMSMTLILIEIPLILATIRPINRGDVIYSQVKTGVGGLTNHETEITF